ncbi:MAG: tRNA lysidine(34) synthetase TilS [Rhodobacteraceae bacterium]|nr:tRNA lysidine(34) synthetase TilS [Paracoccaceae bacterium]
MSRRDFLTDVKDAMRSVPEGRVAVAVSGGGDSIALLLLLARWAQNTGRVIEVVTVDHGLRPEAAAEAEFVSGVCAELGLHHTVLNWQGWDGQGNLMNAARQARRALIVRWAIGRDIGGVVTGHTRDDQAETFLMRLARGSGVDGLAAMYPERRADGVLWLRPLLGFRREELRDYLRKRGVSWVEDPSNEDERFDRIKMRKAMGMLGQLGLGVDVLSDTANRMRRARHALEVTTQALAYSVAGPRQSGVVRLQLDGFLAAPPEVQLRLLAHIMGWVAGAEYRPRLQGLERVLAGISSGQTHTLAGCLISPFGKGCFEICREVNAMKPTENLTAMFDRRWRIDCNLDLTPLTLRALAEDGIAQRTDWRQTAESRNSILSTPSIWYNNELKSVPLLDKDGACSCTLNKGVQSFFESILTH